MRKRTTKKAAIGSAFDDFLKDEGTYEATQQVAIKRVLAWQIEEAMKKQHLTKAEMARRMKPVAANSTGFSTLNISGLRNAAVVHLTKTLADELAPTGSP